MLDDAIKISDRFDAEPVFSKTGKGSYHSDGVKTLQRIKRTNENWWVGE